jgi:hypothetical protein
VGTRNLDRNRQKLVRIIEQIRDLDEEHGASRTRMANQRDAS